MPANPLTHEAALEAMARAPKRIQLRRTKGWRMPEGAVNVARPTKWGNPFIIGEKYPVYEDGILLKRGVTMHTRGDVVCVFRDWVWADAQDDYRLQAIFELSGKTLACWCKPDEQCHADVLLEIANSRPPGDL